jgi:RNA polymerase sigma-70 factor (sigma-E family)
VRADEEARFREFAGERLPRLRRLGYLICGDWHLADDVVSTVLVKLYTRWDRLGTVRNLDGYVRTMLVRAVVDERRRPWRREEVVAEHDPDLDAAPSASAGAADRVVLRDALARMPARRRAVLVLRFFEGMNVDETAEAMGCSPGTVKSQTARALDALREQLPAEDLLLEGS